MCLGAGRPQESGADGVPLAWGQVSLEDYCKSNVAKMVECTSKSTSASEHDADSTSEISTESSKVWDAPSPAPQGTGEPENGKKAEGHPVGSRSATAQVHRLVSMYNELSEVREKQKQCISLLQTKASTREQPQEQVPAPSRQVSSESVPTPKGSERKKAIARRAATLSEVQARHAVCIELTKDRRAQAQVSHGTVQNLPKEGSHEDLLPVLFAQIAVNHVTELAELRKIKETQESLLLQHEALLSENSAMRLRNEAILEELRAQAELNKAPCTGQPKLFGHLGMVAAAVVAAGAAVAVARARS
mmetsp:Transcript_31839/g.73893  ORF Transcript_31839/g.73893 Transcript_31839/m.73893 type:complete len:304 (-) Transcript_31839:196-1107(-)